MKAGTSVAAVVLALVSGCGTAPQAYDWSGWQESPQMLPPGFPFPVREALTTVGARSFWIIDYDVTGDSEPELRIWYLCDRHREGDAGFSMAIARNPYKVERLSLGLLSVYSKLDYRLAGTVEEIQEHLDGTTRTVWLNAPAESPPR